MYRSAIVGLSCASLFVMPGGTAAAESRCSGDKIKAVGKKAASRLICHSKAVSRGLGIDTTCLARADVKFSNAFARAETKNTYDDGCLTTGDASAVGSQIDQFADAIGGCLSGGPYCGTGCFAPASGAAHWYLNGLGPGVPYQIWAFRDDGFPEATSPAVPVPSGADHVAWPSAIRVGSTTRVYASIFASGYQTVGLWTSSDGISLAAQGAVFTADAGEPYGIGPTHVMYEPAAAVPYTMYYLVRGAAGPGPSIAVATSPDGIAWTRQGTVLSATALEEAGGLSVSYACRRADGEYVLVYHGYSSDLSNGVALVATAAGPTQAFGAKTVVKSFDGFDTTITATAGQNVGAAPPSVTVPLGIPLLVADGGREQIVARAQDGTRVWFDRPFLSSHSAAALYSMARRKVELSYVKEMPDGSWRGIFTLYGPAASGVAAEYTTDAAAPSLTGPWSYLGSGFRFQPWLPGTLWSIENPSPLVSDASCAN